MELQNQWNSFINSEYNNNKMKKDYLARYLEAFNNYK
jgi:hypothetical protein